MKYRLSIKQTIEVGNAIQETCILQENNKAKYRDGWSDQRIADECLKDYKGNASGVVMQMRNKLVGVLDRPEAIKKSTNIDRIDRLEKLVQYLCTAAGLNQERINNVLSK